MIRFSEFYRLCTPADTSYLYLKYTSERSEISAHPTVQTLAFHSIRPTVASRIQNLYKQQSRKVAHPTSIIVRVLVVLTSIHSLHFRSCLPNL